MENKAALSRMQGHWRSVCWVSVWLLSLHSQPQWALQQLDLYIDSLVYWIALNHSCLLLHDVELPLHQPQGFRWLTSVPTVWVLPMQNPIGLTHLNTATRTYTRIHSSHMKSEWHKNTALTFQWGTKQLFSIRESRILWRRLRPDFLSGSDSVFYPTASCQPRPVHISNTSRQTRKGCQ